MERSLEPGSADDLVERVDSALEAMWRGDGSVFDSLCEDETSGATPVRVGRVLQDVMGGEGCSIDLSMPGAIPGYTIRREIGRGGMGVVYEAIQHGTERPVAVKVMLGGPFASESARRRFQREIRLAARLEHACIVRILETNALPSGQPFYAMELVEGATLDHFVETNRSDRRVVLDLFRLLCDAVHHAHGQGVVHRDLKPGNVLVDAAGVPRILDFGLAKAIDQSEADAMTAVSSPGQVLGTLRYLSPEQAAGRPDDVDARTDVYALGLMLYETLTACMPYDTTGRASDVMDRIVDMPPVRPSAHAQDVDGETETIILKAIAKDPADRYATAADLAEDLRRYESGEPIAARPPSRLYVLRKRLLRRRREVMLAALALCVALIALWGGSWWRGFSTHRTDERVRVAERRAARIRVLEAQQQIEGGRAESALGTARALFEQEKELPEVALVWAQAQFRVGKADGDNDVVNKAVGVLRQEVDRDPLRDAARTLLAELCEELGRSPPAPLPPGRRPVVTADTWYVRSFATLRLARAAECATRAVRRDPDHALAWRRLAHVCLRTGEADRVVRAAREVVRLGGDRPKWMLLEAEALTRAGRYDEAVERCGRVIDLAPSWNSYRYRAVAELCRQEYARAIDDLTAALSRVRDGSWARYARATPLWIVGRHAEAAADYREFRSERAYATFADARLPLVLFDHARHLEAEGRSADAEAARREARAILAEGVRAAPSASWLSMVLACLSGDLSPSGLVERADSSNAEQMCEAHYYAGEMYLLLDRGDQAVASFRACVDIGLALDPDSGALDPMNEYHLASWRLASMSGATGGP